MYYFQLNNGVAFWAAIGTLYLIFMTYKDLFNNMKIDDRQNFFMMGVSFSLLTHFTVSFWYLISLIAVIFGLRWFLRKYKVIGDADTSALTWLFYGYGLIGFQPFILFIAIFICFTGIYYVIRKVMHIAENKPTPFFPVLLASFILTNIIWSVY